DLSNQGCNPDGENRMLMRGRMGGSLASAIVVAVIAAGLAAQSAQAQGADWPTRPITLVVPFSAGGSSDAIGRIIADGIRTSRNETVIVENVAGTGGLLGGARVARSALDGYQFLIGNVGTVAQSQWLYKKPLYDSLRDFAPVGLLTDEKLVLVARTDFPADD